MTCLEQLPPQSSSNWSPLLTPLFSFLLPGEFVFAVSSDVSSEFWLSTDGSPLNVELLSWVGKVCGGQSFPKRDWNADHRFSNQSLDICVSVCVCVLSRLAQSGQPRASSPSLPVRPPDQFGEVTWYHSVCSTTDSINVIWQFSQLWSLVLLRTPTNMSHTISNPLYLL